MKIIYGVKWFYYLITSEKKPGILTEQNRKKFLDKCLICWEYADVKKPNGKSRLYACFENYLEFARFHLKVLPHQRTFYEIILGEHIQKPHFDLDISLLDSQKFNVLPITVLSDLLSVIIKNIPDCVPEKDICLYSSHGQDKISFHIVVNNFYHENNEQAKAFFNLLASQLPKLYTDNCWIDASVYSKTQHFRMYNSHKFNTSRSKILEKSFILNGEKIDHLSNSYISVDSNNSSLSPEMEFLNNLEESLICARVSTCKRLPNYVETKQYVNSGNFSNKELEESVVDIAMKLLADKLELNLQRNFPFGFDKISGNFIVLKRLKASYCKLCLRTHHHQNPYLLITDSDNVYYHCRRAPADKKLYLGNLKTIESIDKNNIEDSFEEYVPRFYKGYQQETNTNKDKEINEKSDINKETNHKSDKETNHKSDKETNERPNKETNKETNERLDKEATVIINKQKTITIQLKTSNVDVLQKIANEKTKSRTKSKNQKQLFNNILHKRIDKIYNQ